MFVEQFYYGKATPDSETTLEHDILQLSQSLYDLEVETTPYIALLDFQGKTRPHGKTDEAPGP